MIQYMAGHTPSNLVVDYLNDTYDKDNS